MMKTTLGDCLLALTMLAGLLVAPMAIAQKQDQGAVMQVAQQRQLAERGQCDVQPKFAFYMSLGFAAASVDLGACGQGLGNAGLSEQVAATRRIEVAGPPTSLGSGSTLIVGLLPVAGNPVHVLGPFLSTESTIVSDLGSPAIPSRLYCKVHPFWCKRI